MVMSGLQPENPSRCLGIHNPSRNRPDGLTVVTEEGKEGGLSGVGLLVIIFKIIVCTTLNHIILFN
jgi:hypothetical protein